MKSKNLNNSSKKTKNLIKDTFAVMLAEKKELSKINVSELVKRANINRSTFYAHYDDIYGVAEDYENELISHFFDNATLLNSNSIEAFIEVFFSFINDNNYFPTRNELHKELTKYYRKAINTTGGKYLDFRNMIY